MASEKPSWTYQKYLKRIWAEETQITEIKKSFEDVLNNSKKVSERKIAYLQWSDEYPSVSKNLEWKIKVREEWIFIKTSKWELVFNLNWYNDGSEFDFTKDQIEALIILLWGESCLYGWSIGCRETYVFFNNLLWFNEWYLTFPIDINGNNSIYTFYMDSEDESIGTKMNDWVIDKL